MSSRKGMAVPLFLAAATAARGVGGPDVHDTRFVQEPAISAVEGGRAEQGMNDCSAGGMLPCR